MKRRNVAPIYWDKVELLLTPNQIDRARSNKATGYIWMRAADFLRLTTPSDMYVEQVLVPEAQPLDFYNQLSLEGEITIAPFLKVDIVTGQVRAHEGRHRAVALMLLDRSAKLRVSIQLWSKEEGGVFYYREGPPPTWAKAYLTVQDIPSVLTTERFNAEVYKDWGDRRAKVQVDLKNSHNYW